MTVTREDAIKHMEKGGILKFEFYRKIEKGKSFSRRVGQDWEETHSAMTSIPDFYTLLPIIEEDPLPESVRNWVESVRINIEEQPSAREAEILNFFDSKFPKPNPLTWWEVLARELETMERNRVHGGFQVAANLLRERGKLHDSK